MISMTVNVFDLKTNIVNELVGSVDLFTILGLGVIWYLGIKLKMPYEVEILFSLLWLFIIFAEYSGLVLFVFIVLFVGATFYYMANLKIR